MSQGSAAGGRVTLAGFDFGSTTSSALVARAGVGVNCATGRMEFATPQVVYRSDPVFTPFVGEAIDIAAVRDLLLGWLDQAGLDRESLFAGGAIVTGLAARRENADALTRLVEETVGEAVVATADDPRFESWLAFMGSVSGLSRAYPDRAILNLDIGGGTTNPALGLAGNVHSTGCCFIGARHFRFSPGTFEVVAVTDFGRAICRELGIDASIGSILPDRDVSQIVSYLVAGLEALVTGDRGFFATPAGRAIDQVPFETAAADEAVVTFSGGVGEIVYAVVCGAPRPSTTAYGDLGIELAYGILESPRLRRDLTEFRPETGGRATVQGLTLHSTEVSGTTLFLPRPEVLPLRDLPVVASLTAPADVATLQAAVTLAAVAPRGACLQIVWPDAHPALDGVRTFGLDLGKALASVETNGHAIVLLTTANAGKAIGNYATGWQQGHHNLVVIDEIPVRDAQFVNLGRPRHGVVPVSFYGMTACANPQAGN